MVMVQDNGELYWKAQTANPSPGSGVTIIDKQIPLGCTWLKETLFLSQDRRSRPS